MHAARRLIVVAFVATALSTDRPGAAAPVLRPGMAETARTLAGRLVCNLRRTIPAARLAVLQGQPHVRPVQADWRPSARPVIHPHQALPFQFRLPPPLT